jgi:hypothetical protein
MSADKMMLKRQNSYSAQIKNQEERKTNTKKGKQQGNNILTREIILQMIESVN